MRILMRRRNLFKMAILRCAVRERMLYAVLVHTLPISEMQRLHSKTAVSSSWKNTFPAIYNALMRYVKQLIEDKIILIRKWNLLLKVASPDQLYILQTRDQVIQKAPDYKVFGTTKESKKTCLRHWHRKRRCERNCVQQRRY